MTLDVGGNKVELLSGQLTKRHFVPIYKLMKKMGEGDIDEIDFMDGCFDVLCVSINGESKTSEEKIEFLGNLKMQDYNTLAEVMSTNITKMVDESTIDEKKKMN